jgi:hypothetical protein
MHFCPFINEEKLCNAKLERFYQNQSFSVSYSVLNANFLKKNIKISKKSALITVNGTIKLDD